MLAAKIVAKATSEEKKPVGTKPEKNPAAVALRRLGGLRGGRARAKKLSSKNGKR